MVAELMNMAHEEGWIVTPIVLEDDVEEADEDDQEEICQEHRRLHARRREHQESGDSGRSSCLSVVTCLEEDY